LSDVPVHEKKGMAGRMNQEEQWNQFAATGRVMDYLEYRKGIQERNSSLETEGSKEHERNSYTYGDDFNSVSHEGVR
jgi:hypothetical protein